MSASNSAETETALSAAFKVIEWQKCEDRMRELEAICGALAGALEWLIEDQGVEHNQGCPEDDTCDCAHVAKINAALSAFDRLQNQLSPHTSTQTDNP